MRWLREPAAEDALQFRLIDGRFENENGTYTSYGIEISDACGLLAQIQDLSTDREAVLELAQRCEWGGLCRCHVEDVVEDFLSGL